MRPEEFVIRCIDAAVRSDQVKLPPSIDNLEGMSLMGTTWVLSFHKKPIVFERLGFAFEISLLEVNEVVNVACSMESAKAICSAALAYSKINREWFAHWTETEGDIQEDLMILKMATDSYIGAHDAL